ncbi:MAG: TetR/AcrR family transcriptional regulator [Proteobacteria bacterium]|nr:TetR/AcrR family transcriptional regulator [Pseudomonadota bacterium]
MAGWPAEISIDAFRQAWTLEGEGFWRSVFDMHKDKMQVKNPRVAVVNLEKIFRATFHLANSKGFQAMSLRDLSRESGISMGGLYAYIGSKNDLASVIAGVQRKTIEQVIGGLAGAGLEPVHCLRAMIYGEIYMTEILHPWYYFCFMELKGLPREQQQQTLDLEMRFEGFLIDTIRAGEASGQFTCEQPELLAAQVTAQLQQWHLKPWKFKLLDVSTQQYAQYIFENLLLSLHYESAESSSVDDASTILCP